MNIYIVIVSLLCTYVDVITSFACFPECGTLRFGSVTCTSPNYIYRECHVAQADVIYLIKLHQNLTSDACTFKTTFGYRGNSIWVTSGCSGIFYLCYSGSTLDTQYILKLGCRMKYVT